MATVPAPSPFPQDPGPSQGPDITCNLLRAGMVLKPFFAFYDLDIFEEYRPVSFCRISLNLGLSDIFSWLDSDYVFWAGKHGHYLLRGSWQGADLSHLR